MQESKTTNGPYAIEKDYMLQCADPTERIIEIALFQAGIKFERNKLGLDFFLPDYSTCIQVKQLHSDQIAKQMSRALNVISVQGSEAVRFLGMLISIKGIYDAKN